MKIKFLLFCALVLPAGARVADALEPVVAGAPPTAAHIIAQDKNGPYTLQVVRAAWVPSPDGGLALTLWVRVVGDAGAKAPLPPLTFSDYVVDGRIGRPGDLFQMRVVGELKVKHRWVPQSGGTAPVGQSEWRAESARRDWPLVRAEFEFLVPDGAATPDELPPALLDGPARENGVLRRFSVDISNKDIALPPAPPQKAAGMQIVKSGAMRFEIGAPVVSQGNIIESADYPGKRVYEKGNGQGVRIPVLVATGEPVPRFHAGERFGATLTAPSGQGWDMNSERANELRPDGSPLGENEDSFVLNALLPPDTDLKGKWTLNVFRLPSMGDAAQRTFEALSLASPASRVSAIDSKLGADEWEVLDARRFDEAHPLPAIDGHTWRVGGVAVLLRTRVSGDSTPLNIAVSGAKDALGANLQGPHDEARLIGRETRTADGAQFLTYRVILAPKAEVQSPFSLSLQLGRAPAPLPEARVQLTLK